MKLIKERCFKNNINIDHFIFKADNQYNLDVPTTAIRRIQDKNSLIISIEIKENQITKTKKYR